MRYKWMLTIAIILGLALGGYYFFTGAVPVPEPEPIPEPTPVPESIPEPEQTPEPVVESPLTE